MAGLRSIPTHGIGIYVNSDTVFYHFDAISNFKYKFNNYYTDIQSFTESEHSLKFAGFHVPFPRNTDWIADVRRLQSVVDHTFILCSELHEDIVEDLKTLDFPKVTFFLCGFINHRFQHAQVEQWLDWFVTTSHFYTEFNKNFLKKNLHPGNEKYYFDILLGTGKPHRDLIYNYVKENHLEDKNIMTYHRRYNMNLLDSDQYILDQSNIEFIDNHPNRTSQQIRYHNVRMVLSQVIPLDIYNQTHYTLVAETNATNKFNFYTEKTVKPLLAGRLFIAVCSLHFLKNLRSIGFRTFDNVIDESYDNEVDNETRWKMALEEMKKLCQLDPAEVKDKIKDAVAHNQRLLRSRQIYGKFSRRLCDYFDEYITADHIIDG